jgi:hypothetical protein
MASGTRSDPEANNWYLTHLVDRRQKTLRYNDFVTPVAEHNSTSMLCRGDRPLPTTRRQSRVRGISLCVQIDLRAGKSVGTGHLDQAASSLPLRIAATAGQHHMAGGMTTTKRRTAKER